MSTIQILPIPETIVDDLAGLGWEIDPTDGNMTTLFGSPDWQDLKRYVRTTRESGYIPTLDCYEERGAARLQLHVVNDTATLAAALATIRRIADDPDGSISDIANLADLALTEKCTPAVFEDIQVIPPEGPRVTLNPETTTNFALALERAANALEVLRKADLSSLIETLQTLDYVLTHRPNSAQ